MLQISVFFKARKKKNKKIKLSKSIHSHFKTPTKQILLFFK